MSAAHPIVTRIAPSPTGDPHVGTAYVGLFNYVFAKAHGGEFILRLEDTDRQRYNAESEARILEMMRWLGLEPDEGPETGGPNGPYRQSERLEIYRQYAEELLEKGQLYRAFESTEELEQIRKEKGGYDGRARELSQEESDRRAAAGEPFVLRLKTPDEGETSYADELRGTVSIPNRELRDQVMVKSDGFPTYHFAVVVDDHLMGVTHVIRGEDWIVSTPLHVLLYQAFGWQAPTFVHLPLLRNPDKNKSRLSKRKNDTSVDSYRAQGIVPEALLNYLGTMGWSMPDGREFFSLKQMTKAFSLERISLGGPVFDLRRLRHFNAKYIRDILPLEELSRRVKPFLEQAGLDWQDEDYLLDVLDILRPRLETLQDIAHYAYFFREDVSYDLEARKKLASGQKYLEDLEREFARLESYDEDSIDEMLHDYVQAQAVGMGKVMQPLRVALTGAASSPGITEMVSVLGRRRVLGRIGRALTRLNEALPDDNPQKAQEKSQEKSPGKSPKKSETARAS
jgi:glutamyl-tRNA synthetase